MSRYTLVIIEAGDGIKSIALEVVDGKSHFTIASGEDSRKLPATLEAKLKEVIQEIIAYEKASS